MTGRPSNLLVLAPLFVLASLAAHAAAYLAAQPDAAERARLLAGSGHGYLAWTPGILGAAALALVLAVALRVIGAAYGLAGRDPRPLVVLVPVAAFAVQETVERAAAGALSGSFFDQRTFLLGLALQVLFGLVALVVARLLVRGADELGRLLVRRRPPRRAGGALLPASVVVETPHKRQLALRRAGRAPPPTHR